LCRRDTGSRGEALGRNANLGAAKFV